MTPRPRKVSDDDVFAAARRAMSRLGPGELTLAEIAAEAGLTAGALVQRFGSKRELLLRLASHAADSAGDLIAQFRRPRRSPLAALRAYAACLAQMAASPAAIARNFAYLEIDLSDEDFRRRLLAQARATRAALRGLLDEAVVAGELAPATDTAALARTLESLLGGSLLSWAIYRDGSAERWLVRDLESALEPHRGRRGRTRRIAQRQVADGRRRG